MGLRVCFVAVCLCVVGVAAWDGCISCSRQAAMTKDAAAQIPLLMQTSAAVDTELAGAVQDIMRTKYHNTDEIISSIRSLATNCNGASLTVRDIAKGECNTPVVTLSTGSDSAHNKKRILIGFSMHGRELISSETALYLSKKVCGAVGVGTIPINDALANTIIDFVPVVNPMGRKRADNPSADGSHTCTNMRKNRNLVDLNRNFDFSFEQRSDSHSETFPGPSAMSECETQTLAQIVDEQAATGNPYKAYVDIHSGEDAMGYVYGASKALSDTLDNTDKTAMQTITSEINKQVFQSSSLGSRWTGHLVVMGGAAAYESHGCASDYMYDKKGIKFSMTWEIWRQPTSSKKKKQGLNLHQIDDVAVLDAAATLPKDDIKTTAGVDDAKIILEANAKMEASASKTTPVAGDMTIITAAAAADATAATATAADDNTAAAGEPSPAAGADVKLTPAVADAQVTPAAADVDGKAMPGAVDVSAVPIRLVDAPVAPAVAAADALIPDGPSSSPQAAALIPDGQSLAQINVDLMGDMNADQCFLYFNPVTEASYDSTVNEWSDALLVLAKEIGSR